MSDRINSSGGVKPKKPKAPPLVRIIWWGITALFAAVFLVFLFNAPVYRALPASLSRIEGIAFIVSLLAVSPKVSIGVILAIGVALLILFRILLGKILPSFFIAAAACVLLLDVGVPAAASTIRAKLPFTAKTVVEEVQRITATVTTDSLNMRSDPSANGKVVKTPKKGDVLTVTGDTVNGWTPVEFDGAQGYVSTQYIVVN